MEYKSRERSDIISTDSNVITREPVVKQVLEKPQVAKIVEIKNVEIRSQPVVQEIREQPIIELEKKHVTERIQQDDIVKHQRAKTQYEEVHVGDQMNAPKFNFPQPETQTFKEANVKHVQLDERKQIIEREVIERHIVPMVTEERYQKIVNVIEQPIVRTIYKEPIIRELNREAPLQKSSFVPKVDDLQMAKMDLQDAKPLASDEFKQELEGFKLEGGHDHASFVPKPQELLEQKSHLHNAKPLSQDAFKSELMEYKQEHPSHASFVPKPQELLEQKYQLHTAKPLSSFEFKEEISQHRGELTDSSAWRETQEELPSTRVMLEKNLISQPHREGEFSTEEFKEELSRGKSLLHEAKPFSSESFEHELEIGKQRLEHNTNPLATEEFREEIQYGQEVLHDAFPLSREGFAEELQAQKLKLEKSRYFSKPVFMPEFMAQKMLLKPSTESKYSREINLNGEAWKREQLDLIEKAKDVVHNAVDAVMETFESAKAVFMGEKK